MIRGIKNPGNALGTQVIEDIDKRWMAKALALSKLAAARGEVPVAAILVRNGKVLALAANQRETLPSPLGHAELLCLHRGALKLSSWRLLDCTLYVTLEPCVMCAGALVQARISRLVYAATDPKGGAVHSLYQILSDTRLNHQLKVTGGVLAQESSEILQKFFRDRRAAKRKKS